MDHLVQIIKNSRAGNDADNALADSATSESDASFADSTELPKSTAAAGSVYNNTKSQELDPATQGLLRTLENSAKKNQTRKANKEKVKYHAVWVSDMHLGMPCTNSECMLDFLNSIECNYLFLVGDIIDFLAMRKKLYWPEQHNAVLRRILEIANESETEVIYIPGNHDEIMREYTGLKFSNVKIEYEYAHETLDGRKMLVLHGDKFDKVVGMSKTLTILGSESYVMLLKMSRWVNSFRKMVNMEYWSLSKSVKHKVKEAVKYISDYEHAVVDQIKNTDYDGVICGHIHHAEIREIDGYEYHNCGDWVESCTVLVERTNGDMNIVYWMDERAREFELQKSPLITEPA